jgi:hypothetical protein
LETAEAIHFFNVGAVDVLGIFGFRVRVVFDEIGRLVFGRCLVQLSCFSSRSIWSMALAQFKNVSSSDESTAVPVLRKRKAVEIAQSNNDTLSDSSSDASSDSSNPKSDAASQSADSDQAS